MRLPKKNLIEKKSHHKRKRAAIALPVQNQTQIKKTLIEFFGQHRELQFGFGQGLDDGGFGAFRARCCGR